MTSSDADSHKNHPMYRLALQNLQKGEWEAGLNNLDSLMEAFPYEQDLRQLRQEMVLRARVDQDEQEDKVRSRRQRSRNLLVRSSIVVILLLLAVVVYRSYNQFISRQFALTQQTVQAQLQNVNQAVKFRDAQDYLRAGRTDQALTMLNEIAAENPNYPGLAAELDKANQQKSLDDKYQQAMGLIQEKDFPAALVLLQEIELIEPFYRDVKLQINNLQRQSLLGDLLAEADVAYQASNWEEAVAGYEEINNLAPDFETSYVEDRLYNSYLKAADLKLYSSDSLEALQLAEQYYRKALSLRPQDPEVKEKQAKARSLVEEKQFFSYLELAQQAIAEQPDSITALQVAEGYLSKALILRPNDPEVADQRDLARGYLAAQAAFKQGEWDDVITNLEAVIAKDQGYANGTAMQSLYEAYVARGDSLMAIGSFDQALADYQRAAVLAEEHSESKLRVYEIQLKIADALGVTGEYEQAVKLYRAAIELANLRQGAVENNITAMETALADAEEYVSQGNFRQAFSSYRAAVAWATQTFQMVEHTVDSDDYLSSLALEYGSTVSLIAEANNIANPNIIIPGQVLLIPILP